MIRVMQAALILPGRLRRVFDRPPVPYSSIRVGNACLTTGGWSEIPGVASTNCKLCII
jgi:hypothetical protein